MYTKSLVNKPVLVSRPTTRRASRSTKIIRSQRLDVEKSLFGENLGARDPYPAELESNFSEKVLGNFNTEHLIKPPEKINSIVGLSSKDCSAEYDIMVSESDVNRLKLQVPGWRVEKHGADKAKDNVTPAFRLLQEFKAKDAAACDALMTRIKGVTSSAGHNAASLTPILNNTMIKVELYTTKFNSVTVNDFILASKLNAMPIADLAPPKRQKFWA